MLAALTHFLRELQAAVIHTLGTMLAIPHFTLNSLKTC